MSMISPLRDAQSERDRQIVDLEQWLASHPHLRQQSCYERAEGRLIALRVAHPSTGFAPDGGDAA